MKKRETSTLKWKKNGDCQKVEYDYDDGYDSNLLNFLLKDGPELNWCDGTR